MRVTLQNRQIHNPTAKVLLLILFITIIIATTPIWLPLHAILRLAGRKGFLHNKPDGLHIIIRSEGFQPKTP